MAKSHMIMLDISLLIREMQIKTTMIYHLTPGIKLIIKETKDKCSYKLGENKTLHTVHWKCMLVKSF
jgi:hypothetical protein